MTKIINLSLDSVPEDNKGLIDTFTFNPELKEATLKLNGVHKGESALTFPIKFDRYQDFERSCIENFQNELDKFQDLGPLEKVDILGVLVDDANKSLILNSIKEHYREDLSEEPEEQEQGQQREQQKQEGWEDDYYDVWGRKIPEQEKQQQSAKSKDDEQKDKRRTYTIFKYSQMGKGDLHESAVVDGLPYFIKYNSIAQAIELIEQIEGNSRILIPPQGPEDYPYTPYEFESKEEIESYIGKAKDTTLDTIYTKCKSIFSTFVDQDNRIIVLLTADSIWTYFQDLFPTTHYSEGVGTNDVGKSSLGYTFEYTGYRVIKAVAISGANYYRILGSIEPGQCVIIEDEGDSISEDTDKVKILKSGYEYTGRVPKINMNIRDQDQKWWKTYCYKMILAEKSLKEYKAKGLVDRTFSFPLGPGSVKYAIKSVVANTPKKNPRLQRLYDELMSFRKLMLCYRLVHYKDELPEIETCLKNRDNELCEPLLQLFYGTEAIKEIIPALELFVKQRRDRRARSLDAALYPIIKKHVFRELGLNSETDSWLELKSKKQNLVKIPFHEYIWGDIVGADGRIKAEIEGHLNPDNKYEYKTVDYGSLFLTTLPNHIYQKFGADIKKQSYGVALIFNIDKLEKFESLYGANEFKDDIVKIEVTQKSDDYDRYDGYDGFPDVCPSTTTSNNNNDNQ